MALKFFLMYLGIFFASSLVIMTTIKRLSSSFGNQGKKPWIFNFISSALASGVAFSATYLTKNLFITFWILSAIFLLFGFLFVVLVHKKYFRARSDNRNKQLFAEILFALSILLLCVVIFSSLQYFLKNKNFIFFPTLLSMLFFLIPVLLWHTFDAVYSIPQPQHISWKYPVNQVIDLPDEKENEQLYVIGFEIAKKSTDGSRTYFRAKAPEDMILGDLYYHFINDYNEQYSETAIAYADKDNVDHWVFRTKPAKWFHFSRILDPTITVNQNKIKENTVIICERVNEL